MNSLLNNRSFQIVFLILTGLLILLGGQAEMNLPNSDQTFYARKAIEMLETGDIWTLRYNGRPAFENTPLPIWMIALGFKIFGISRYAVTLTAALFSVGTLFLVYRLAENLFNDRKVAFLAVFILLFPGIFLSYGRRALVDASVTFFITLSLFGFFKGLKNPKWYLLFGLGSGFAILSKSVFGFFPIVIASSFLIFTRRSREFFQPWFLGGLGAGLAVGCSWYGVNALTHGTWFLRKHFGWLILHRAFNPDEEDPFSLMEAVYPLFFLGYVWELLKTHWPWVPLVFWGAWIFLTKAWREKDEAHLFVLLWIGVLLIVLSLSQAQRINYLLSAFPAMALLAAKTIADHLPERGWNRLMPAMSCFLLGIAFLVSATPINLKDFAHKQPGGIYLRDLGPAVNRNTLPGEPVGAYRMRPWNHRMGFFFYTDRYLANKTEAAQGLLESLEKKFPATWLTRYEEYQNLKKRHPDKLYAIHGNDRYVYFTSAENKINISYDYSGDFLTYNR